MTKAEAIEYARRIMRELPSNPTADEIRQTIVCILFGGPVDLSFREKLRAQIVDDVMKELTGLRYALRKIAGADTVEEARDWAQKVLEAGE